MADDISDDIVAYNVTEFNDTMVATSPQSQVRYEYIVTSVICSVGVVGNISNIAVLRMRNTQNGLDNIGKAAILGLLALTVSDLMFCVVGVVSGVLIAISSGGDVMRGIAIMGFLCTMYRGACINIFLFISTWCITLLSIERYMVVCHPFMSRKLISTPSVIISRATVAFLSVVINFPLFIRFTVHWGDCEGDMTCFYTIPNPSAYRVPLMTYHRVSWASVGTFLPLILLLFANVRLGREVMKVKNNNEAAKNGTVMFQVTKTLVVIAISYMLLVCPSMLLNFLNTNELITGRGYVYHQAVTLGNICQAVQFSCNFLLYCTINKTFRQSLC